MTELKGGIWKGSANNTEASTFHMTLPHSPIEEEVLNGHANRVFCVKYNPDDPNFLVSGGWDLNVKIWDIRQPNPVRQIFGPYICGNAIDLNQDVIVTGSYRDSNQLELWDFGSGKHIGKVGWNKQLPSEEPCFIYCT